MGWGGHVADAINRMRANEALKKRKHEIHKKMMDAYSSKSTHRDVNPDIFDKKLSPAKLVKFRAQLKMDRKRENYISVLTLILSLIIVALIAYIIIT